MNLKEVLDICIDIVPNDWKSGREAVYDDGRLRVVRVPDDYLGNKEVLVAIDGKQFLRYRENYANSRYVRSVEFEDYVNSDDFAANRAKALLLN